VGTMGATIGTTTGGTAAGPPPPPPQGNITTGTNTTPNTTAATAANTLGTNAAAAANPPANTVATVAAAANTGNQLAAQNSHNPNATALPRNPAATVNQLLQPKPTPIPGPFYAACKQFPITNLVQETTHLNAMYVALFHQDPLMPHERAMAVCAQPRPLPLLAINKTNNTATILHCLTILYLPQRLPGLTPSHRPHTCAGWQSLLWHTRNHQHTRQCICRCTGMARRHHR